MATTPANQSAYLKRNGSRFKLLSGQDTSSIIEAGFEDDAEQEQD